MVFFGAHVEWHPWFFDLSISSMRLETEISWVFKWVFNLVLDVHPSRFVQFRRLRTSVWDENIDAGFMFTLENFHGKLRDGVRCRTWPAMMLGGSSSSRCHPPQPMQEQNEHITSNFKRRIWSQNNLLPCPRYRVLFQAFQPLTGLLQAMPLRKLQPNKKKKAVKPKTKKVSVPGANRRFRMVPETLHPGLAAMPLDCMHLDFLSPPPPKKKVWSTSYITTKMFGELGTSTSTSTSTST